MSTPTATTIVPDISAKYRSAISVGWKIEPCIKYKDAFALAFEQTLLKGFCSMKTQIVLHLKT